jgi:hypothetical protein
MTVRKVQHADEDDDFGAEDPPQEYERADTQKKTSVRLLSLPTAGQTHNGGGVPRLLQLDRNAS